MDERMMKRAEELLHGEFSVALGIDEDSVKPFIEKKVKEIEQRNGIADPYGRSVQE